VILRRSIPFIQRAASLALTLAFAASTLRATPPNAPTNIRAVSLPAENLLTWDPVPDAQYYSVQRAGFDRRWAPVGKVTVPRIRDTDFRSFPCLYKILVLNEAGEGASSPEITVSNRSPSVSLIGVNPRPVSDTAFAIVLNLLGTGDGLLEIGATAGSYNTVFWEEALSSRHEFVISNLQPATTYFFRLTSASSYGDGVTYASAFTTQPFTEPVALVPIPSSSAVTLTTLEDTPVRMTLVPQNDAGQNWQFQISSPPYGGYLIELFPDLIYVPRQEGPGPEYFQVTATDGVVSYSTTVVIDVQQVYDSPIVHDRSIRVDKNLGLKFPVSAFSYDVNSSQFRFMMVTPPTNGVLTRPSFESGEFQYVPNTNFSGIDHFTFTATDGITTGNVATVRIRVAPTAVNQTLTVSRYDVTPCTLLGNDTEVGGTAFTPTSTPKWGTLSWPQPNVTGFFAYTPAPRITNNTDQFTYTVTYEGRVTAATVTLNIAPTYFPPTANPVSVVTDSNQPVAIQLSGSSFDGTPVSYWMIQGPTHGTLTGSAPDLVYTPALGFVGTDSFVFRTTDGRGYSPETTATISVVPLSAPAAPSGLVATAVSSTQIDVVWIDNARNEDSFQIETSNDNRSWKPLATLPANSTSFSHTHLLGNRTYAYRIRGVTGIGVSAYSNTSATRTLR
jgi:hypothetical protein